MRKAMRRPPVINRVQSDFATSRPTSHRAASSSQDIDSGKGRTTDKSCIRCRERKVRCSRSFPHCISCTRRGESCEYGDEVDGEDVQSRSPMDRIRIKRCSSKSKRATPLPNLSPVISRSSAPSEHIDPLSPTLPAFSLLSLDETCGAIYEAVTQNAGPEQHAAMYNFLASVSAVAAEGESRVVAKELVSHLLDASTYSCSLRLPAFGSLAEQISTYKEHLDKLSPVERVAVAVLCTVGARANPFPAFLGSSVSPTPMSLAGQKRDKICEALVDLTVNLFFREPSLQESRREHLESLIAIVQLLTEEFQKDRSRSILRLALGMYNDLIRSSSEEDVAILKQTYGPALFENDSLTSAYSTSQSLIPRFDLASLFDNGSLPDFSHGDLLIALDYLLSGGPLSYKAIQAATANATTWVAGAFRIFSVISLELPLSALVNEIRTLWKHIDRAHASVQRLRQTLSEIDDIPGGHGSASSAIEDQVLLAVKMDIRLISLVHLIHRFLEGLTGAGSEVRETLIIDSWLRVKKCLKLFSFYSHFYATSHNKYLVYRLVLALELLPSWTEIAVQRAGEDQGAFSNEYEVSDEELDWLTTALQLACFYTSIAPQRLSKLLSNRHRPNPVQRSATPSPYTSPDLSPISAPSEDLPTPPSEFLLLPSTSPFSYLSGEAFGVYAQNAVSEGFKNAVSHDEGFQGQLWLDTPVWEMQDVGGGPWDEVVGGEDQQWYL